MGVGVMYVAFGAKAHREAADSIASLRQYHDWPVLVVGDKPIAGERFRRIEDRGTPGRWAKVNLDKLSPWSQTLFLDADTRVCGRLDLGFRLLDFGWQVVMVPSLPQREKGLRHLSVEERRVTLDELPVDPLQLNTGVMWFSRDAAPLFDVWRAEWERWRDKDQGAFLRALERRPAKIALLDQAFNSKGGAVVDHRFGACVV
jgi:hypothetical protein